MKTVFFLEVILYLILESSVECAIQYESTLQSNGIDKQDLLDLKIDALARGSFAEDESQYIDKSRDNLASQKDTDIYAIYDYSSREYAGVSVSTSKQHQLGVQSIL